MAYTYGLKYQSNGLFPQGWENPISVNIYKKDYTGEASSLLLEKGGVSIGIDPNEYFDPIISTFAEINVVNDKDDFFELDDLFSISDFEYKVKIYDTEHTYFEGFIPCDVVEQKYSLNGVVTLNATNNLKRLEEYKPTIFLTKGEAVLPITVIKHCLSFTGLDLDIYVNVKLWGATAYEESDYTLHSVFDSQYVNSDLFLETSDLFSKDILEYKDCGAILEDFLIAFDCKLYYWDGKWFIERVKDLGTSDSDGKRDYIRYYSGGYYTYPQTVETYQIGNTSANPRYMDVSQTIAYVPGVKKIEITQKPTLVLNYVNYTYDDINILTYEQYDLDRFWGYGSHPDGGGAYWKWDAAYECTVTPIHNYFGIVNGVTLYNNHVTSSDLPYYTIVNYLEDSWEDWKKYELRDSMSGIYTKLNLKGIVANNTTMTFKMKFRLPIDFINGIPEFTNSFLSYPEKHTFYVRFFMRRSAIAGYGGAIVYDTTTGEYIEGALGSVYIAGFGTIDGGLFRYDEYPIAIEIAIPFDQFTDKARFTTEFTTTIPFDSFLVDYADDAMFGICEIGYKGPNDANYGNLPNSPYFALKTSHFGDIVVSFSSDVEDNIVTGAVTEDFVNTLDQTVNIFDTAQFLNSLWDDVTMNNRTATWIDSTSETTLVKKMIEDRFQIYNKVRREIRSSLYYANYLRPFALFTDTHFTNSFYLSSFRWVLDSNKYDGVVLKEYVGDDGIT